MGHILETNDGVQSLSHSTEGMWVEAQLYPLTTKLCFIQVIVKQKQYIPKQLIGYC